MATTPDYDLFVSYAEADSGWVEGFLIDALTAAGVKVHSEAAFALGRPRLLEFERAVTQSRRVLLVVSSAYLADESGRFVELLAQSYGDEVGTWPVIPLVLEPVALPVRLSMLTDLDATDPGEREATVERLCAHLQRPAPAPAPAPSCPYPGMRPFTLAEAPVFCGREAETEELVRRLHALRASTRRLLTVIGPSGSGKSSLVYAGLVPALQESGLFGADAWELLSLRPGDATMTTPTSVIGADPAQTGPSLERLLELAPTGPRLVVVDQFEELFTATGLQIPAQIAAFESAVAALAAVPDTYVVLTARADFYPDLMASSLWPLVQTSRVEVLPLDEAGLREAIVVPADRVGVYIEVALVERLAADAAGEPGVLPLVQQTLVLLWEHLERRYLPLRAYEALVLPTEAYEGTSSDRRTGLEVAVAHHADAVLAELTAAQQAIARRVFLRLIHFGVGRADTRRQRALDELRNVGDDPALFAATLRSLATHRLLTLSTTTLPTSDSNNVSKVSVDLAHEALIAGWPWLHTLIAERREAEQARERIEGKAAEWVRLGKARGGLLDEAELAEAERWMSGPDATELGYSEAVRALVTTSRRTLARERQRLRRRLHGAVAFAGLALVTAVFAFLQYRAAEDHARQAEAAQATAEWQIEVNRVQALAAQVQLQQELGEGDRSLLLARQAYLMDVESGGWVQDQVDDVLRRVLSEETTGEVLHHPAWVTAVAYSPDGSTLATGGSDATVHLWDVTRADAQPSVLHTGAGVTAIAFSPDGSLLAVAGKDGTTRVWDLARPADEPDLFRHDDTVNAVAFSPDGSMLATASNDKTARLWSVTRPDTAPAKLHHDDWVSTVVFLPDGSTLATGSFDTAVRLWDVAEPSGEPVVLDHGAQVTSLDVSPDGSLLAVATSDTMVQLWNLPSHTPFHRIDNHRSATTIAFNVDGSILATGSSDHAVRLWTLARPDVRPVVLRQNVWVTSVAYSPDGATLAAGDVDGTVNLWNPNTDMLADEVCLRLERNLTAREWQLFIGSDLPYQETCTFAVAEELVDVGSPVATPLSPPPGGEIAAQPGGNQPAPTSS